MTSDEAIHVLELKPSAGPSTVKKAFRRLAKQHHPDLRRDAGAVVDFTRIVEAYTTLQREFRLLEGNGDARVCPACGHIGELFDGLDGGVECADCLLGVSTRRLLLPSTPIRMVRHLPVILLELAAVVMFVRGLVSGSSSSLIASMVLCVAALAILAIVCAVVRQVR